MIEFKYREQHRCIPDKNNWRYNMCKNTPTVINKDFCSIIMETLRFFLKHSTIEYDGTKKVARINYSGPKGWNLSFESSFSSILHD